MSQSTTVPRPVFDEHMNAAARKDFRRRAAAWDLAEKTGEPTEDYIDECAYMLASIRRWANRSAAAWERSNDPSYPAAYWMIFRAFTSLPAEYDRKHTTDRRH